MDETKSPERNLPGAEHLAESETILAGRYRVIRELGRGGMAAVYLCSDLTAGSQVALKVLHPYLRSIVTTKRFLQEIEYVTALDHPAIPRIIGTGMIGEVPFFTMAYVQGESLRAQLVERSRFSIDSAVTAIANIVEPVTYAHRKGILHRDLKPENILISSTGFHVLDFGIARALIRSSGDRLTSTGLTVGTPAYVSPEQALAEKDLDERSDIYSLGCVAFEMIIGAQPFTGRTPQSIVAKRFVAPPPRLRELRSDVPEHVDAAVAKALSKNRDDRWPSADAFASALSGEQLQIPTPAPTQNQAQSRFLGKLKRAFGSD